jgi:general secretion pathway protein D
VLKAFAPLATVCMLITLVCASVPAEAHPASAGIWFLLSIAGQSSGDDDARSESDRLLAAARQAMAAGDLDRAESLVDQAESLGAHYDEVTARFEGPQKVRRDIQRLRDAQSPATPPADNPFSGRGGRFPELMPPPDAAQRQADRIGTLPARSTSLERSPFADQPPIDPRNIHHDDGSSGGAFMPIGTAGGPSAAKPPADDAQPQAGAQPQADARPRANANPQAGRKPQAVATPRANVRQLLHEARRALAVGDMRKASAIVAQAKQMGGQFAPHEDSPARVQQVLQRMTQIARTPGDPRQKAKQAAQLMMEQAEELLRYDDVQAARTLAQQAARIPVQYGPYESSPEHLLRRIKEMQQGGGSRIAPQGEGGKLGQARSLLARAKLSMERGQLEAALDLVRQAEATNLPLEAFDNQEIRPWKLRAEIEQAIQRRGGVGFAGYNAEPESGKSYPGRQSAYSPELDRTRNVAASAMQPTPAQLSETPHQGAAAGGAETMLRQGLAALKEGHRDEAREILLKAWERREELDPTALQMLQDHLTQLNSAPLAEPLPKSEQPSPLEEAEQKRLVLQQKVRREIISEQAAADRMLQEDPLGALQKLQNLRDRVARSELDGDVRKALLTLVDRAVGRTNQYIEEHRADIESDERNAAILQDLELERKRRLETQNTLAGLVDRFNELIDQQRYAEAEVVAKQAREIAPDEPVVTTIMEKAKLARRVAEQMRIKEEKENGFAGQLNSVDAASTPFDDRDPYRHGDIRWWEDMTANRQRLNERNRRRITETEQQIYDSLTKKVKVSFKNRPLSEVLSLLGNMAGINIHADPTGLAAEGVTTATPVSIDLSREVSLRSALNLILEPFHLSYVVENEVLRVTSEQVRESHTYPLVYNVADLVIPIPNFVPSYNIGLPGAEACR